VTAPTRSLRRLATLGAGVLLAGSALVACGGDDSGGGGGSAESFCSVSDELQASDFDASSFDADKLQQSLDDAVDAAPDEIRSDVETVRDAFEGIDFSDPKTFTDPEILQQLESPELEEASNNIEQYSKQNCQ